MIRGTTTAGSTTLSAEMFKLAMASFGTMTLERATFTRAAFVIRDSLTTKLAITELMAVSVTIWVCLILKLLMIVYATVHHINGGVDNNNFDDEGVVELRYNSCLCMIVY